MPYHKRLPPLNSLRAFEAVSRHLSIAKAAAELYVTHSAVSQQIKVLEKYLGITLLDRGGGKIKLMEHAKDYVAELNNAFYKIQQATQQLLRSDDNILTINLLSTFAMRWLIPRLQNFQDQHPEIEIRLSTPTHWVDFKTESIDLAIYYGEGNWPDLHIEFLFAEYLLPVCSPGLFAKIKHMTIKETLAKYKAIYVKTAERRNAWSIWLTAMSLSEPKLSNRQYFQNSTQALEAAANSLGIAMAPAAFIKDDISSKRLVVPFKKKVKSPYDFYLVCPESYLQRKKVKVFRDWIFAECKKLKS